MCLSLPDLSCSATWVSHMGLHQPYHGMASTLRAYKHRIFHMNNSYYFLTADWACLFSQRMQIARYVQSRFFQTFAQQTNTLLQLSCRKDVRSGLLCLLRWGVTICKLPPLQTDLSKLFFPWCFCHKFVSQHVGFHRKAYVACLRQ